MPAPRPRASKPKTSFMAATKPRRLRIPLPYSASTPRPLEASSLRKLFAIIPTAACTAAVEEGEEEEEGDLEGADGDHEAGDDDAALVGGEADEAAVLLLHLLEAGDDGAEGGRVEAHAEEPHHHRHHVEGLGADAPVALPHHVDAHTACQSHVFKPPNKEA